MKLHAALLFQSETQVMREYAAGKKRPLHPPKWCMLSEPTVKTHIRARLCQGAGVRSRQEFLDANEQS